MKPVFFKTQGDLHKWLMKNSGKKTELSIGFYKVSSGKKGITPKEALDEALIFGWIDGVRHSIDEESYKNRYTPRRRGSNWSNINIKRVKELIELGLMQPKGLEEFEKRDKEKSGSYSFENKKPELSEEFTKKFKFNKKAWEYFSNKAPWYKRTSAHWVMSAKKEETRLRRLETLIADSENGKDIALLDRTKK